MAEDNIRESDQETPSKQVKALGKEKRKKRDRSRKAGTANWFSRLLDNDKVIILVLKAVLFLVIPYAYLFLCGFIFDLWLKWYFMTTFIFFSLIALYILAIVLIVIMIKRFIRK